LAGEARKYLVHVELAAATVERVAEAGAAMVATLTEISRGEVCTAYRSMGHDLFGFFVKTTMAPPEIRAALDAPNIRNRGARGLYQVSAFRSGDRVLIVDVGSDAISIGKDEAARWLQRN
jgi:hypothetical protein